MTRKKCKIFSIANQKGGVGKTTTTISLAQYFASKGQKVLVIDLDSQGHVAKSFGHKASDAVLGVVISGVPIPAVILRARPNLDVISSGKRTEPTLSTYLLSNYREKASLALASTFLGFIEEGRYDYVFIDTPPASGILQTSAVVMSDYVIVPINPERLSLEGLSEMMTTLAAVRQMPDLEVPPVFFGVLLTRYDRNTNVTKRMVTNAISMVGGDKSLILPPIPTDAKIREASEYGQTVFEFAPNSPGAIGFENDALAKNSQGRIGGYLHLAEIIEAL